MRQINPDVVAAYPITPQTEVVQIYAQFVADGKVDTRVRHRRERALGHERRDRLGGRRGAHHDGHLARRASPSCGRCSTSPPRYRLPVVMTTVNRALSGPINIHCDHSDTMGGRDSGWIQLYGENHQEAYDNVIQAVSIAEHLDVRLPVMTMYDGYVISGAIGPLQMISR